MTLHWIKKIYVYVYKGETLYWILSVIFFQRVFAVVALTVWKGRVGCHPPDVVDVSFDKLHRK